METNRSFGGLVGEDTFLATAKSLEPTNLIAFNQPFGIGLSDLGKKNLDWLIDSIYCPANLDSIRKVSGKKVDSNVLAIQILAFSKSPETLERRLAITEAKVIQDAWESLTLLADKVAKMIRGKDQMGGKLGITRDQALLLFALCVEHVWRLELEAGQEPR